MQPTADPTADPSADPSSRILRAGALAIAGAVLICLAMIGSACRAGSTPSTVLMPKVITVYVPVPILVQSPKPEPTRLTVMGCSHGTVGISVANAPQPHWVIASLHVRSPRALKNLRLTSIELLDKAGKVVVRSARPESIRIGKPQVSYPDRCLPYARQRPSHLSKSGTRPYDGRIAAQKRHRLWLHIRMAGDYFHAARTRPTRCRVTFTTTNGKKLTSTIDQVGGWPTG